LILIKNEILRAVSKKSSSYVFCPDEHSPIQREFFKKRARSLQKHLQLGGAETSFEPNQAHKYAANSERCFTWDAVEELRIFRSKIANSMQNRLLDYLPFECQDVFTPFRKKAELLLPDHYPEAIAPFDEAVIARLDRYFSSDLPLTYLDTRNQMMGEDFSSQFSPYLACGALDVRHLYNCIKTYEQKNAATKSTYWLVFELMWREFFYWNYQKHGRLYFSRNGIQGSADFTPYTKYSIHALKPMSSNKFWRAALHEIETTGFPSNRTRQLFASFWVHNLALDWRSGADFYQRHLIDYDVYSNWGNWMYIAGVGASKSKRIFDIQGQLERYDPESKFIKRWA